MVRVRKSVIFFIAVFIGYTALSFINPQQAAAQAPIGLVINGRVVDNLDVPPVMRENRMLVPAGHVFYMLGAEINWNPVNRAVHIQYYDIHIHLTIGETVMFVGSDVVIMPVPAQIINNRTMLPLGIIADSLGFYTYFYNRTVFVYTGYYIPGNEPEPPYYPPYYPPYENGDNGYEPPPTPTPAPPAYMQRVRYDFISRTLHIPRAGGLNLNIGQAIHIDMYHQHQYMLMLTADASRHIVAERLNIGDALLTSIDITHGQFGMQIIFQGRQIIALDIAQNYTYYLVRVMCPREKYARIVVIDPGHGGYRPGAVYNGVRAADLNLAVARKLVQLLEELRLLLVNN